MISEKPLFPALRHCSFLYTISSKLYALCIEPSSIDVLVVKWKWLECLCQKISGDLGIRDNV